jgi:hypothetical protein
MAPVVDVQHPAALTIIHTEHKFRTAASEDVLETISIHTNTHTQTITIIPAEHMASSTSRPAPVKGDVGSIYCDMFHRSPRGLHSPTSLPSRNTLAAPRVSTPARRSICFYPSPPDFQYPHTNIPRTACEMLQSTPNMTGAPSNTIWYLPYGLEVLICTVMVLGLVWMGLVMLLNFPPATWTWGGTARDERRPLDKSSKRFSICRRHSATGDKGEDAGLSAQTPSTSCSREDPRLAEPGIKLTHRRHQNPTSTYQRSHSSPTTVTRFAKPQSSPCIPSPPNPFLRPPVKVPTLLNTPSTPEWLANHTAFFSTNLSVSRTPSLHSSRQSCVAGTDDYDVEALEAGTTPLKPRIVKKHERKGSWVDLGLGRVEDAVSGFVGRVARWTDEEEGEGMLLPVVNGGIGMKVE